MVKTVALRRMAIGVALFSWALLGAGAAPTTPTTVKPAPPPLYMRLTILTPEAPAVKGLVRSVWYNRPWRGAPAPDILGADGKMAPPGTASAWGNISPSFNWGSFGTNTVRLLLQGEKNKPMPEHWKARVEFATSVASALAVADFPTLAGELGHKKAAAASAAPPKSDVIVKTYEEEWDGDNLVYMITLTREDAARFAKSPDIQSIHEVTAKHMADAESAVADLPGGKGDCLPKYFNFQTTVTAWSRDQIAAEMRVVRKLGFNGPLMQTYNAMPRGAVELQRSQEAARAAGLDLSKSWSMQYMGVKCSFDPEAKAENDKRYAKYAKDLKQLAPEVFANLSLINLGDETRMLNDLRHIPGCPFCQAAFREWLKKRGVTPQQVGCNTWDEVKPIAWDETGPAPVRASSVQTRRLGWYSHLFSVETGGLPFKYATETIQKVYGRPVQTCFNPSDGAVVCQDMTIDGNGWSFPALGRLGATTLPWTEDWPMGNPHLTPFLADLLRSSGPTQHIPLGMYMIFGWVPSKEPHFCQLKTMSAAARGLKTFNHYMYGPRFANTANTFSESAAYMKDVACVNRVLGLSDDVLGPAMPPDRQVAILWSMASDQWRNTWVAAKAGAPIREADGTFGIERRMLHFALTMQQIPVDFIDEMDIPSRLKEYKVLFMPASHLPFDCVPVIQDWVKAGGTLIAGNGGPDRDEVNEPLPGFLALQGLARIERRQDGPKPGKTFLYEMEQNVSAKPTTEVTLAGAQTPIGVAGFKAVLTPAAGAKVLGSYKEGGAAAVEYRLGQGRVITFGFNPGITLLMKMDPAVLAKKDMFWDVFPPNELKMISDPVIQAGALPPVSTQVGVDAARLDGPNGSAVTLANYTLKPIQNLPVRVRGLPNVSKVVSVSRGPLAFKQTPDGITFEIPLGAIDVVTCRK